MDIQISRLLKEIEIDKQLIQFHNDRIAINQQKLKDLEYTVTKKE